MTAGAHPRGTYPVEGAPIEWRTLFDGISEAVMVAGLDYRISLVNRAMCEFAGLAEAEMLGRRCHEVVHGASEPVPACPTRQMLELGSTCATIVPIGDRICEVAVSPGGDSLETGVFVHVLRDITRYVLAEERVKEANHILEATVEARTDELRTLVRSLEAAGAASDSFLANMSHELRTPLNSIIGFSGVLLSGLAGELSEEQRKQIAAINASGRHLLAIIEDMLDLSRIRAGELRFEQEAVDLAALTGECVESVRLLAEERGLGLRFESAEGSVPVMSDTTRVRQIVLNLLSNAVKFTETGLITVGCELTTDGAEVSVSDTGCGIAAAQIELVFDEFFQAKSARAGKPKGTGLGLAVSRRLARMLGGDVTVVSEPGVGSTFTLRLPREHSPLDSADA